MLHGEEKVVLSKKMLTPTPISPHLGHIFKKDSTNEAQVASEDVNTTQRESWRAQKHYLEKSPSTVNSAAIGDNDTIPSQNYQNQSQTANCNVQRPSYPDPPANLLRAALLNFCPPNVTKCFGCKGNIRSPPVTTIPFSHDLCIISKAKRPIRRDVSCCCDLYK